MEQYYTPEIEDFRVGYEYERLNDKTWNKETLESHMLYTPNIGEACDSEITEILRDLHDNKIRVPYLTKEQIKAEGWELRTEGYSRNFYEKGEESLLVHHVGHWIIITDLSEEQIYKGDCKSINEFRTIMKLLNIK